jgi:hypothetical protein
MEFGAASTSWDYREYPLTRSPQECACVVLVVSTTSSTRVELTNRPFPLVVNGSQNTLTSPILPRLQVWFRHISLCVRCKPRASGRWVGEPTFEWVRPCGPSPCQPASFSNDTVNSWVPVSQRNHRGGRPPAIDESFSGRRCRTHDYAHTSILLEQRPARLRRLAAPTHVPR